MAVVKYDFVHDVKPKVKNIFLFSIHECVYQEQHTTCIYKDIQV